MEFRGLLEVRGPEVSLDKIGSGDSGASLADSLVSRPKYTKGIASSGSKFSPQMIGTPRTGTGNCSVMLMDSSTMKTREKVPKMKMKMHDTV